MATWYAAVTNAGINLQSRTISGGTITITKAQSGSGSVPVVDLRSQTALVNVRQLLQISGYWSTNNVATISTLLKTIDLEESYGLRQIGIYAQDPDVGEILFAIAQSDQEITIPTEEEMPMYSMTINTHISMSNSQTLTCTVDPAGLVTSELFWEQIGYLNWKTGSILSGTLEAGQTTLVISNEAIESTDMVDIYTSVYGLNPDEVTVLDGSISLVFESQDDDVDVKVVVRSGSL